MIVQMRSTERTMRCSEAMPNNVVMEKLLCVGEEEGGRRGQVVETLEIAHLQLLLQETDRGSYRT